MSPKRPRDPALTRLVKSLVEGTLPDERVIFIDKDNRVREAVYPSAYETGDLEAVRERLEKSGDLKAILHISAHSQGGKGSRGMRWSTLLYLPDNIYYGVKREVSPAWVLKEDDDGDYTRAVKNTRQLFGEEGDQEEQEA